MAPAKKSKKSGLLERLAAGPVICAEGYLFEFERRGYLQAGAFVPEIVLEHPDLVAELHREFVHAGSDVVEAFTYYAHREKLRVIGREKDLEKINKQALKIAKKVAKEHGSLVAGNICNTSVYVPDDAKAAKEVRRQFREQIGWADDAKADFIVGETYSFGGEALLATQMIKKHSSLPAVVTLAIHREDTTREGWSVAETCKRLEAAGADAAAARRGPQGGEGADRRVAGALPDDQERAEFPVAHRPALRLPAAREAVSDRARSVHLQPLGDRRVH